MSFQDFMNKVRHWDNSLSKWILRHFYFMFFQIVLFIIFLFWFVNMFKVIDLSFHPNKSIPEHLLTTLSINSTIIVFILLLNSFWMLYMFNVLQRITTMLKDLTYQMNRLRVKNYQKD